MYKYSRNVFKKYWHIGRIQLQKMRFTVLENVLDKKTITLLKSLLINLIHELICHITSCLKSEYNVN